MIQSQSNEPSSVLVYLANHPFRQEKAPVLGAGSAFSAFYGMVNPQLFLGEPAQLF